MQKKSMSLVAIIFFIAIGAGCIYAYFTVHKNYNLTKDWPSTKASVINSNIEYVGPRYGYKLLITYRFTVNGKEYESGNVHKGLIRYYSKGDAQDEMNGIVSNPIVTYNPQDPTDCCVVTYKPGFLFTIVLLAGIILSLVGWIALIGRLF